MRDLTRKKDIVSLSTKLENRLVGNLEVEREELNHLKATLQEENIKNSYFGFYYGPCLMNLNKMTFKAIIIMWINIIYKEKYQDSKKRGLRLRFEKSVDLDIRNQCISFCQWLRKNYYFPIRIYIYLYDNIYFINKVERGGKTCGLFFDGNELTKKLPRIWIAVRQKAGIEGVLLTIAHELTHYYQWYFLETEERSSRSLEIEANRWAYFLLQEYYAYDC